LGAKRSSRAGIATIHLFSSVRNRHKTFDGPVNSSEMPMTISLLSNKEQKSSENKFFKIDATASSARLTGASEPAHVARSLSEVQQRSRMINVLQSCSRRPLTSIFIPLSSSALA